VVDETLVFCVEGEFFGGEGVGVEGEVQGMGGEEGRGTEGVGEEVGGFGDVDGGKEVEFVVFGLLFCGGGTMQS
jgi:hypothetical protein